LIIYLRYTVVYSIARCQLSGAAPMDKQVKSGNHVELSIMSSKGVAPMLYNINL